MAKKNTSKDSIDSFKIGKLKIGLIIFSFATVMALMNWIRFVSNELALGRSGRFRFYFIMETTGVYTIVILIPLLFWFFKRFPITRKNLVSSIPLHILASMIFGVCHTLLMYSSRIAIFWIFDLGIFNYGSLKYRILQEYGHQWFTYWIFFGVALFIKYIKENQQQKLHTAKLEQLLTQANLQALKMQLNPHFFFNTLNMISSTMYEDVKAADTMIAHLSDLLRKTLKSTDKEKYTLEEEMELLHLYIEILKARFQDNLEITLAVQDETLNALLPRFILQPLVENSIKHSMGKLDKTIVKIEVQREADRLTITVTDNGPGISGEVDQVIHNGMGLANTSERLEKLYGKHHCFQFQNIGKGGLQVKIEIPFQESKMEDHKDERD